MLQLPRPPVREENEKNFLALLHQPATDANSLGKVSAAIGRVPPLNVPQALSYVANRNAVENLLGCIALE